MNNDLVKYGLVWGSVIGLMIILPYVASDYFLNLVTSMMIYSLFALSFNILVGQGGMLSFGHSAFFGVGAYTVINLFKHFDVSLLPGLFCSSFLGALSGLVIGIFVVRLSGTYFALLTLAFSMLILAGADKWRFITGGEDGLSGQRHDLYLPLIGRIDMFPIVNWYYFVLFTVIVCAFFCYFFTKTPLGRLNECLRENEDRARFIGYNVYLTKVIIFVISSFFAGLAGGLMGAFQEVATTTFINMDKSADVLFMTYIGGVRAFWGPILGACFLTYFNEIVSSLTQYWSIPQGILFIVLFMYARNGLSGLLIQLKTQILGGLFTKGK